MRTKKGGCYRGNLCEWYSEGVDGSEAAESTGGTYYLKASLEDS